MNIFSAFGKGGGKPKGEPAVGLAQSLPTVNSFVDVACEGSPRRQSVAVNEIGDTYLITRCPEGLRAGKKADFLYSNTSGRFRFWATCKRVEGANAYFELPATIKRLESFAHRGAARVDKVIPIDWRYAPDAKGYGEYLSGSMSDLSRGGASLVVGRLVKPGTSLEVRFSLDPKGPKLLEICQVMRAAKIGTSASFTAGIRFLAMSSANEAALMAFLQEVQATRRDRGIV